MFKEVINKQQKVRKEASVWLSKMDRGLSVKEHEAFISWLSKDSSHSDAYEKQKQNWGRMDSLVDWRPEHSAALNPDLLAPSKKNESSYWVLGGSFAMATILILMLFQGVFNRPIVDQQSVPTVSSEVTTEILNDGSRLLIKGHAEYTVEFTNFERKVYLHSGEIYYDVEKDTERPFIVESNGILLRAVGTAFNVNATEQSIHLIVEEGLVSMNGGANDYDSSSQEPFEALYVSANQQLFVYADKEKPRLETLTNAQVKNHIAWQHRKLIFKDESLAEICEEFNRLNKVQIILEDPALKEVFISGSIQSDNIAGFLNLIYVGFGVVAEEIDENSILLFKSLQKKE